MQTNGTTLLHRCTSSQTKPNVNDYFDLWNLTRSHVALRAFMYVCARACSSPNNANIKQTFVFPHFSKCSFFFQCSAIACSVPVLCVLSGATAIFPVFWIHSHKFLVQFSLQFAWSWLWIYMHRESMFWSLIPLPLSLTLPFFGVSSDEKRQSFVITARFLLILQCAFYLG